MEAHSVKLLSVTSPLYTLWGLFILAWGVDEVERFGEEDESAEEHQEGHYKNLVNALS